LCTDGFRSYIKFAQGNDSIHKRLDVAAGVKVIEKVFHIQNVNAYHNRLKGWMDRFHGVATKYLENYLGWFRFLDTNENPNKNNLFKALQHLVGT
jgi:IS1 family transposase